MRRRRLIAAILLMALLLCAAPARSSDWLTAGGGPDRASRSAESVGAAFPGMLWNVSSMEPGMAPLVNFGTSAAQPIAVTQSGNTYLFHLAGSYLWRLTLKPDGGLQEIKELNGGELEGTPVNPDKTTPFSTPTYSPETKTLYFGNNGGQIFGYSLAQGTFLSEQVSDAEEGCRMIASPLVLQVAGREVVVVGDRPQDDRTNCGQVWVAWGLDGSGALGHSQYKGSDFGGWVTPSPIPVPGEPDKLIVGADGTCKGSRMVKLRVEPDALGFSLTRVKGFEVPCAEADSGFAGSFAADPANDVFYWLDTGANLWAARISDGKKPEGWSERSIHLPSKVEGAVGASGFTNTAPAIGSDGTVYVTLRNFANAGEDLRGCPGLAPTAECKFPGAPGAVLAISPNGQAKWGYRQDEIQGTYKSAINTDPLVLETGLLLYGDVNGRIHARSLETGLPSTLTLSEGCSYATLSSLLKEGEIPDGGTRTYSQTFGVSVSPMVTAPLLVTGVNVAKVRKEKNAKGEEVEAVEATFHRLVGIATRSAYNLAWSSSAPSEPIQPDANGLLRVSGEVLMEVGPLPLNQVRPAGVKVEWYAIPKETWQSYLAQTYTPPSPAAYYLGERLLPSNLAAGQLFPLDFATFPAQGWPAEGYLVGVIDAQRLPFYMGQWEAVLASWLYSSREEDPMRDNCSGSAAEMVRVKRNGVFANALADNFLLIPYRLATDLAISLEIPTNPIPGELIAQYQQAYITVTNKGKVPVGAPGTDVLLYAAWPGIVAEQQIGGKQILLGPGETLKLAMPFQVMNCNASGTLRAVINTAKQPLETDWSNNSASLTVQVGPCRINSVPTPPSDRPTRTIIVPPDCIPDTDPKSRRLCTNYPKELYDW